MRLEFVELKRPVIERRRQAKTVIDQIFLARAVTFVHAPHLANADVRLIDEHQGIRWQIVNQGWWRLTCLAPGKMSRVIFNPLAETDLIEHFQVKLGALLDTLRLDQFVIANEVIDALLQLLLDRLDGTQHGRPGCHVMRGREDREAQRLVQQMPG